jgi:hypothetical protein
VRRSGYTDAMSTRRRLLALTALVAQGAALGQAAPRPAGPPRYEVEVIVFAYRDLDPTEEYFDQSLAGLPDASLAGPLMPPVFDESMFETRALPPVPAPPAIPDPSLAPSDESLVPVEDPLLVRTLRADELKLGAEYRRLRAISAYVPLLHTGWVQPGLAENETVPFDLGTIGTLNPSGTVRVHLSRFLHVTLDLTYRADGTASATDAMTGLSEVTLAPRYRLAATRNVRSGELHYFDHPAFGVLVRVTPRAALDPASGRRPAA